MLRQTWMEIYTDNLRSNYREVRRLIPEDCKIIAVVKGNAYSHGAVETAKVFRSEGCQWFAVATPEEALELRCNGIKEKILVMAASTAEAAEAYITNDISAACGDFRFLDVMNRAALKTGKKARVHIKFDTGLSRTGFFETDIPKLTQKLRYSEGIIMEGAFTHFATADETNPDYTKWQYSRFKNAMSDMAAKGFPSDFQHVCNSPATVNFPEYSLDAVRPGNLLYGLPSGRCSRTVALKPACAFKTRIAVIRELEARTGVGYGLKYMTRGRQRTGILPVGFYDGMTRLLSGKAEVLVRGRRVPVIGNIYLDQTIIDLTEVPEAREGDEVVLIGRQGEEEISVKDVADKLGSIVTQVLSFITARVPRVYI